MQSFLDAQAAEGSGRGVGVVFIPFTLALWLYYSDVRGCEIEKSTLCSENNVLKFSWSSHHHGRKYSTQSSMF